jgi:plastocyanin
MRVRRLISIVVVALLSAAAGESEQVVHQKGRAFSIETMTVARGEPIVFLNDDTVPHNIMSTTPDNAFNLGIQTPGEATPVTFDTAGIVEVICAIHPRMRLTIRVTN